MTSLLSFERRVRVDCGSMPSFQTESQHSDGGN